MRYQGAFFLIFGGLWGWRMTDFGGWLIKHVNAQDCRSSSALRPGRHLRRRVCILFDKVLATSLFAHSCEDALSNSLLTLQSHPQVLPPFICWYIRTASTLLPEDSKPSPHSWGQHSQLHHRRLASSHPNPSSVAPITLHNSSLYIWATMAAEPSLEDVQSFIEITGGQVTDQQARQLLKVCAALNSTDKLYALLFC